MADPREREALQQAADVAYAAAERLQELVREWDAREDELEAKQARFRRLKGEPRGRLRPVHTTGNAS